LVEEFIEDLQCRFNEQALAQKADLLSTCSADGFPDLNVSSAPPPRTNDTNLVEIKSVETIAPHTPIDSPTSEQRIDFAIITAIKIERLAILKCFEIDEVSDRFRFPKNNRTYWRTRLRLRDGNFYEIVVAQTLDTANVEAALLTNDLIRDWDPKAILMVGIAAAAKPEQSLGDLIVGKEIYCYEMSKITDSGHLYEPRTIRTDPVLRDRANSFDNKFSILVDPPDRCANFPNVTIGVIASGDKVIADASERDKIASTNRKIMAIEMEGYGVVSAAWQSFEQIRCLVIRALCDYADNDKNDAWHEYAAAVAAGYTKHFLLDRPLEPVNLPEIFS
jgi:nucleoside phosphorylase